MVRAICEPQGAMADIASPCNKICTVDPASKQCIGCGRTLAEIGSWLALSAQERERIMAQLPQRLALMRARKPADVT
jgi:hypothetical protein